jgi:hypothetical protein
MGKAEWPAANSRTKWRVTAEAGVAEGRRPPMRHLAQGWAD